MLVGFDATTIRGNKTGVGYYTARLLERLTVVDGRINPIDEMVVLSNLEVPLLKKPPRVSVYEEGRFGVRALWMQGILPSILKRVRPDVCHFTNFLAPVWTEVPFVVTFHDMSLQIMPRYHAIKKRLLTKSLMPTIAKRAKLVITPSRSAKEDVARMMGIPRSKIRTIPHAPDPFFRPDRSEASFERLATKYGIRRPYLLYVGTLEPRKNLRRAVEAFANLRHGFSDHCFYLVGDLGWKYQDLLRAIDERGLRGRVKRLGYVEEEDLPPLYSHADLFVYPSLYEGFGFPVVEAMACGTPVLTSNTSSLAEVAGGAALLADPHDVAEITELMELGLTDGLERECLAVSGLARARSFSWERAARETLAVYEEAAERTTVRSRTTNREKPQEAQPASDEARAVIETVRYASFFRFPMKLGEIHRGLLGVQLSRTEIESLLAYSPSVRSHIESSGIFHFLRGRGGDIAERWSCEAATRQLLSLHQKHIDLLCRTPFVRMVALSGATAHGTASDGDIDLFIITAPGRAWAVSLLLTVGAKLLGIRRRMCVNYLVSEERLTLQEHDPFTANQLVSLKPLAGLHTYYRFIRANGWGAAYYPNFWSHFREFVPNDGSRRRAGSPWLEALLGVGGGWLLERMGRALFRGYLRMKHRRVGIPSSVKLERDRIKLHFNDNAHPLEIKLQEMLAEIRSGRSIDEGRASERLRWQVFQ